MKKSLILIFIFTCLSQVYAFFAFANNCAQVYSEISILKNSSQAKSTDRKAVELFQLLSPELQTSIRSLAELHLSTELMKQKNPDSIVAVSLNDTYQKKYHQHLEYFLSTEIMNENEMKSIMREYILEKQGRLKQDKDQENERRRKEEERIVIEKRPFDPAYVQKHMVFHAIRPGNFKMGGDQVDTEITKPFEMMATQVTQMMWASLKVAMGVKDLNKINPSSSKRYRDSITVYIEGFDIQMKPDHPVEMVSYDDVKEFIDGLNKLSNSSETKDQALLDKLIPGHKKGDIYDFPTEAQWEFVMRDRGNANKKFFDRDDITDLSKHAWSSENSDYHTHAVATLKPRMIDTNGDGIRRPFYDLEGNVSEWVKDPQVPTDRDSRVVRNGHWGLAAEESYSSGRMLIYLGKSLNWVGFRLVRHVPQFANSSPSLPHNKTHTKIQTSQPIQQQKQGIFKRIKSFFGTSAQQEEYK
jgi:formylglycine-generating enzyme required for sulfatase activity